MMVMSTIRRRHVIILQPETNHVSGHKHKIKLNPPNNLSSSSSCSTSVQGSS